VLVVDPDSGANAVWQPASRSPFDMLLLRIPTRFCSILGGHSSVAYPIIRSHASGGQARRAAALRGQAPATEYPWRTTVGCVGWPWRLCRLFWWGVCLDTGVLSATLTHVRACVRPPDRACIRRRGRGTCSPAGGPTAIGSGGV